MPDRFRSARRSHRACRSQSTCRAHHAGDNRRSAGAGAASPAALNITSVGQAAGRWLLTRERGSRLPVGTALRFTLSDPARVTITFTQTRSGRRKGSRCVTRTAKLVKTGAKTCQITATASAVTTLGHRGANTIAFKGKAGPKTLIPGAYVATFTTPASSEKPTLRFTIVGP